MKLTIISSERLKSLEGDLHTDNALADLIRAEVTAKERCSRWATILRIAKALNRDYEENCERLAGLCRSLEYEGDITTGAGGWLYASPVRAIETQSNTFRLISSLPTNRLRVDLPGELAIVGVDRFLHFSEESRGELEDAIKRLGGVVLSPNEWAGLDRVPIADQSFLQRHDERLKFEAKSAGSGDTADPSWSHFVSGEGSRWSWKDGSSQLWRAKNSFGYWVWAWTSGKAPSHDDFVILSNDDAARSFFALARDSEFKIRVALERKADSAQLSINDWLPRAEYRYLSMLGSVTRERGCFCWMFQNTNLEKVTCTLSERLGILTEKVTSE